MKTTMYLLLLVAVCVGCLLLEVQKGETSSLKCTNAKLALENYYNQCVVTGTLMTIQKYAAMGKSPGQMESTLVRHACVCMVESFTVEAFADAFCQYDDATMSKSLKVDAMQGGKCTKMAPW